MKKKRLKLDFSSDDWSYILLCRFYLILSMITKTLSKLTEGFKFLSSLLQAFFKLGNL